MSKKIDPRKEEWVVCFDGSICTKRTWQQKSDHGVKYMSPIYIGFNMGAELAHYIVNLHNASLKPKAPEDQFTLPAA